METVWLFILSCKEFSRLNGKEFVSGELSVVSGVL